MPVTGNKPLLSYSLSIRQCADGFSFLVHSTGSGGLVLTENIHLSEGESMADALERGLMKPRIHNRQYERVALFSTSPSTRIPLDEFRREDIVALYRLTFAGAQVRTEDIRYQVLPNLEVVEIFSLNNLVENTLKRHYPSALVQSLYGSMLRYVASVNQGNLMPVSYHVLSIDGGIMVAVLNQGKLTFANVYRAEHDEDKLYFMLYVWNMIKLDPWHDECVLYGLGEALYNKVQKFIATVDYFEMPQLCAL